MIAFDTDVLTEILLGNASYSARASTIPAHEQTVPVIVVEEIIRGRLNIIRQAEANNAKISLERAYDLFEETFRDFQQLYILSYTPQADQIYRQWRQEKVRVATHDLRIAAICVAHRATLISRNRQDYAQIPGLTVQFWS